MTNPYCKRSAAPTTQHMPTDRRLRPEIDDAAAGKPIRARISQFLLSTLVKDTQSLVDSHTVRLRNRAADSPMSQHIFLTCDACNQLGIRVVEARRGRGRDPRNGRRITDGRAWFDGNEEEAKASGWMVLDDRRHVCPDCYRRGLHKALMDPG